MNSFLGGVLSLGLLALLVFACIWIIRRLHARADAARWLRIAAVVLGLVGGIGLCFVRYRPRPDLEIEGFPIMVAEFERSGDGGWIDFVPSPPAALLVVALNAMVAMAGLHGSALIWLWFRRRPGRSEAPRPDPGS